MYNRQYRESKSNSPTVFPLTIQQWQNQCIQLQNNRMKMFRINIATRFRVKPIFSLSIAVIALHADVTLSVTELNFAVRSGDPNAPFFPHDH